jgi:electron transport complex protein RnfG
MNEVLRMFVVLAGICLTSAFALTALNQGLADQIAKQKRDNVQVPTAREILAGVPADFADHYFEIEVDGVPYGIFPWIQDGHCKAVTLETAGQGGYAGEVRVMTGIDLDQGTVIGVRVTQSGETPGVGSRAADPNYLRTYRNRTLNGTRFQLAKNGGDIQAVTGATKTSTAVADGVNKAVAFVLAHKDEIARQAVTGTAGTQTGGTK